MGNPGVFEFSFPDGNGAYYLHWADPIYQIPIIGEWVADTLSAREPLTRAAWEAWFPAHYFDASRDLVSMTKTDVVPGMDVGRSHGALHRYTLEAAAETFLFTCRTRDLSAVAEDSRWKEAAWCFSVDDLLNEGVSQVRRLRRRVCQLRRRHGLRIDQYAQRYSSVSELTDWIRECQQRAERHARDFPATTTVVLHYGGKRWQRPVASMADLEAMAGEHRIRLTSEGYDREGRWLRRGVIEPTRTRARLVIEHRVNGHLVPGYKPAIDHSTVRG